MLAIEAALAAGDILREGFGTRFSIERKEGIHNLVTEYDHKAEKSILQFLKENGPKAQFLAEESGSSGANEDLLWVIDPLDGTVNFAHGIPVFAVSIALQKKGVVELGVVYQPITQELFVAEKGKGAFLDGKKIQVSQTAKVQDSILATGFPYNLYENPFHCIEHFVDILKAGIPIRRLGAATIDFAYTAAGRFEGFFEASLAPWDCAAGKLLVEEAGGRVSSWEGKPFDIHSRRPVLASNGLIHAETVKQLSKAL
jgi:myo-inositol-1(or 4)-monophosphatase